MTIKYKPISDEQLEKVAEERANGALTILNLLDDESIPSGLLSALEDAVFDYDWEGEVLMDDYNLFLDMVDDMGRGF